MQVAHILHPSIPSRDSVHLGLLGYMWARQSKQWALRLVLHIWRGSYTATWGVPSTGGRLKLTKRNKWHATTGDGGSMQLSATTANPKHLNVFGQFLISNCRKLLAREVNFYPDAFLMFYSTDVLQGLSLWWAWRSAILMMRSKIYTFNVLEDHLVRSTLEMHSKINQLHMLEELFLWLRHLLFMFIFEWNKPAHHCFTLREKIATQSQRKSQN